MHASKRVCFPAMLIVLLSPTLPAKAVSLFEPGSANIAGGVEISFTEVDDVRGTPTLTLGGVPAVNIKSVRRKCDDGIPCGVTFTFIAPPQESPGVVDAVITYPASQPSVLKNVFTYYDAPVISRIDPSQHSFLPDDTVVSIYALGLSVYPGVQVYFGDRPATDVAVNKNGTSLSCLPPPFPGGPFPLPVDVRVVNPNGANTIASGKFEYGPVTPIVTGGGIGPAWTINTQAGVNVIHLIPQDIHVYVDGVPAPISTIYEYSNPESSTVYFFPPAHPPGSASLTIVNGDGGTFTNYRGFFYTGTISTDYHTADLNHDFKFNLPELLRVIQLYRAGQFHCESGTEDGYALGPGDRSCSPYASDHDPQDWQIGLSEVLEVVQFYNLNCYQPCPDAPGTYCPPTPAS